jgi:hypothetical protein
LVDDEGRRRQVSERTLRDVYLPPFRDALDEGAGSVTRPVKELKGFRRISLDPGQAARVRYKVPVHVLGFHGPDMVHKVEPGSLRLWIGLDWTTGLEGASVVSGT